MENKFLAAEPNIIAFHRKITEHGVWVNTETPKMYKQGHPKPFAEGAIWSITSDAIAFHQAIFSLCSSGWAFSTPLLLRTLLELLLSAGIIGNPDNKQDYWGFRYTCFFMKRLLQEEGFPEDKKEEMKNNINEDIKKLPSEAREEARNFIFNTKMYGYWFRPEYKNLKDVVEKIVNPKVDLKFSYDFFSGVAHGGFLGLRSFRDDSDEIHPHPRADKRSQNLALLYSSQLILDLTLVRGVFEEIPIEDSDQSLRAEFLKFVQYVQ